MKISTVIRIVGIEDPLRDVVRKAVEDCQKAGVAVKMCTGVRPAEVSPVIGFAKLPKPEDENAECEPEISAFYHHGSSNSNNGHSLGESRRSAAVNMTNSPYYACTHSHSNPSSNHRHLSPFGRLNSHYPLSQQQSSLSHMAYSPYASDNSVPPAESPLSSSSANESLLPENGDYIYPYNMTDNLVASYRSRIAGAVNIYKQILLQSIRLQSSCRSISSVSRY